MENATGKVFSIQVIVNYKLEREFLGFGSKLKVLGPLILLKRIRENLLVKALESYAAVDDGKVIEEGE